MNPLRYAVKLSAEDHGFVVTCRDLPEAITQGASRAEALEAAAGALQAAIKGRLLDRDDVPQPTAARRGEALVDVPA
jgi:antitoxin HicB